MKLVKYGLALFAVTVFLASLCSCQSGLDYTESDLAMFNAVKRGKQLPFVTSKGSQLAFYIAPKSGTKLPNPLIMVFPGIGSPCTL